MSLLNKIKEDQLTARKNKNTDEASLLTTLLSESAIVGKNQGRESTDEEVIAVVKKFIKNNTKYITDIGDSNAEKSSKLSNELAILKRYVPSKLSEDRLKELVVEFLASSTSADMGEVMKHMKANYDGQYDGKMLSSIVKGVLK